MVDLSKFARHGKPHPAWVFATIVPRLDATLDEVFDLKDTRERVENARALIVYVMSDAGGVVDLSFPDVAAIFGFALGMVGRYRAAISQRILKDHEFRGRVEAWTAEIKGKAGQPAPDLQVLNGPRAPVAALAPATPSVPRPVVPAPAPVAAPAPAPATPPEDATLGLSWPSSAILGQIMQAVCSVTGISEKDFWKTEGTKGYMARICLMYILRLIYKIDDERARQIFMIPIGQINEGVRMMQNFLREDAKQPTALRSVHSALVRLVETGDGAPQAPIPPPAPIAPLPTPRLVAPAPPRTSLAPPRVPVAVPAAPRVVSSNVDRTREIIVPADEARAEVIQITFDPRVTFSNVFAAVAHVTGVSEDVLESSSRVSDDAVAARRLAMLLLWVICGFSDEDIGELLTRPTDQVRGGRVKTQSEIVMYPTVRDRAVRIFAHIMAAVGGVRVAPAPEPVRAPAVPAPVGPAAAVPSAPVRALTPAPTPARVAVPVPPPADAVGGNRGPSGRRYTTTTPAHRQAAMSSILERLGAVSPGQLVQELMAQGMDLSVHTIRRDMEALMAGSEGRLTVDGERTARRYRLDGRQAVVTEEAAPARQRPAMPASPPLGDPDCGRDGALGPDRPAAVVPRQTVQAAPAPVAEPASGEWRLLLKEPTLAELEEKDR